MFIMYDPFFELLCSLSKWCYVRCHVWSTS